MAEITWKNIGGTSFADSNRLFINGMNTLNNAANGLNDFADDMKGIAKNQWDEGTQRNTEAEIANMQNIKTLKDYYAQRDNFNLAGVRERNGLQADFDQITSANKALESRLNDAAIAAATTVGRDVGESSRSKAQAAEAFRKSMADQGVQDKNLIQSATANFLDNSLATFGVQQEELLRKNDKEVYGIVEGMGDITSLSNSEVRQKVIDQLGDNVSEARIIAATDDLRKQQMQTKLNGLEAQAEAAFKNKGVLSVNDVLSKINDPAITPAMKDAMLLRYGQREQSLIQNSEIAQINLQQAEAESVQAEADLNSIVDRNMRANELVLSNLEITEDDRLRADNIIGNNGQGLASNLITQASDATLNSFRNVDTYELRNTVSEMQRYLEDKGGVSSRDTAAIITKAWGNLGGFSEGTRSMNQAHTTEDLVEEIARVWSKYDNTRDTELTALSNREKFMAQKATIKSKVANSYADQRGKIIGAVLSGKPVPKASFKGHEKYKQDLENFSTAPSATGQQVRSSIFAGKTPDEVVAMMKNQAGIEPKKVNPLFPTGPASAITMGGKAILDKIKQW